jgi:hypothetical protein
MLKTPIFSDSFLSHYLLDFKAYSFTNIRAISLTLKALIKNIESGKTQSLKEEEIKSQFITDFFGDILGFNYGNSNKWQLREEKKSKTDGKKSDAALGYFYIDKGKDDVRAVIEIKNAKTNLDLKQKRANNQTPVEQAFGYAHKMGGKCKWVIVSNILEIRFYLANDSSRYQYYKITDLLREYKRDELLFLWHKDSFIIESNQSQTDKLLVLQETAKTEGDAPLHIVDRVYQAVLKFEGLGFVDPNYLCTIPPFNILGEHVWHYHNGNLLTLNHELYDLLEAITIVNNEVILNQEYSEVLKVNEVDNAKNKLEKVFKFLNHCMIYNLSVVKNYKEVEQRNKNTIGFSIYHHFGFIEKVEGTTKNVLIADNYACDCLSCNYRNMQFNKLLERLKVGAGNEALNNLEYAYGNYLVATNNFKQTYNIYKSIEKDTKGKEGREVEYFLTKLNIKYLHNLIKDYQYEDSKAILDDIKSVDLDRVLYDEIEYRVDKDVKNYLIQVKDNTLIYKIQDDVEEQLLEIEKVKDLYDRGGSLISGPNLTENLINNYFALYSHVNRNFIIYDIFKRYKSLTEKVFTGLIKCHSIPKYGLKEFNEFFLMEAILHIQPRSLQDILKTVDKLNIREDQLNKLTPKFKEFLESYSKIGFFNDPIKNELFDEQLKNYRFKDKFCDLFTNWFTVLGKIDISESQFEEIKLSLLRLLKIENELYWFNMKEFGTFLLGKGNLFNGSELNEILTIAINGTEYGKNKYDNLLQQVAVSIRRFYPEFKITSVKLIKTAILNCTADNPEHSKLEILINLVKICDEQTKNILFAAFEDQLNARFNIELYEKLLLTEMYDFDRSNYFKTYSECVNKQKGGSALKYGDYELTDAYFINYISLVYHLNIDLDREELKELKDLNSFETWLLDPWNFDYHDFHPHWLIDLKNTLIIEKINTIKSIKKAIEKQLKLNYNPILAEIRFSHFK